MFPYVLFLVPDLIRKRQVEQIIERGEPEARGLFHVGLSSGFPDFLFVDNTTE